MGAAGNEPAVQRPPVSSPTQSCHGNQNPVERPAKPPRAYALIGSAGRTATHWLAAAFNLHERVFFSHGPDLEPRKSGRDEGGLERFLRIARQIETFDFNDYDRYFDLLEAQGDFTVYGNVHGIFPARPDRLASAYRRAYFGCAVMRHPVPRVQSFMQRWRYEAQVSELRREIYSPAHFEANQRRVVTNLARRYGVNRIDQDAVLFVRALDTIVQFDRYFFDSGLPLFRMERLVDDTDYFLELFDQATGGLVEADDRFIAALEDLQPIEQRQKQRAAPRSFESWAPWQQRYFYDRLAAANLPGCYAELGYDLRPIFTELV